MPRYFFDTSDNGDLTDDTGLDFGSLEEARAAALDALPEMARDSLPRGNHSAVSVTVRDEAGRHMLRATLTLDVERML